MPKAPKKLTQHASKQITDFFVRKSSMASSSPIRDSKLGSSQEPIVITDREPSASKTSNKRKTSDLNSSQIHSVKPSITSSSSTKTIPDVSLTLPGPMTRSRSRTPEVRTTVPLPRKPSSKRKAPENDKLSSENDVAPAPRTRSRRNSRATPLSSKENLAHTLTKDSPVPRKKLRLPPSPEEYVPGSQPDEVDIPTSALSNRNLEAVEEDVAEWGQQSPDVVMDTDMCLPSPISAIVTERASSSSPLPASAEPTPQKDVPSTSSFQQPTPPLTEKGIGTPMLDVDTKTARLIADIKARAAAITSSPEVSPIRELRELEDSDDDDGLYMSESKAIVCASVASTSTTSMDVDQSPQLHYGMRNSDTTKATTNKPAPRKAPPPVKRPAPKPKQVEIPFQDLLNERNKQGKGKTAVAKSGKATENQDWADEDKAMQAVLACENLLASPTLDGSSIDDAVISNLEHNKLLGEQNGKAVKNILEDDFKNKKSSEDGIHGVPLWRVTDDEDIFMDSVPPPIPKLSSSVAEKHPVLQALKHAIDHQEFNQACFLINTCILNMRNLQANADAIMYLCDLALHPSQNSLVNCGFKVLFKIWSYTSETPGIRLPSILRALQSYGANPTVLQDIKLSVDGLGESTNLTQSERETHLYRLVTLISASALRLSTADTPDILIILLLIGMDPSTSADLERDIIVTIHTVCSSLRGAKSEEISAVCTRILLYARTLEPAEQAQLISLFGIDSGRTGQIAQCVAHSLISGSDSLSWIELPPLNAMLEQICSRTSMFSIQPDTDYDVMGHYVSLLSVALSRIDEYVADEKEAQGSSPPTPSKVLGDKPPTMLETIQKAIEKLHGRIVDTRAAHLDRSRSKALLKQLSKKIQYQRKAAIDARSNNRPKDLHFFFNKNHTLDS